MAPIRIRHAQGTSTVDIDLDNSTVLELQQEIRRVTNILPSQQEGQPNNDPVSESAAFYTVIYSDTSIDMI
jgi:ubiquitin thioesterase OTU1